MAKKNTKKKVVKKKVTRKRTRKPPKAETIYNSGFVGRVKSIISDIPFNQRSGLAYGKIAKGLGISEKTLKRWRTPGTEYYIKEFADSIIEAEKQLRESIDLVEIQRGVINKAKGKSKKIKKIREPVTVGPALPAFGRYTRAGLVQYAKKYLKLKLDPKAKKDIMEMAIRERVEELTKEEMKIVRIEEEQQPPDMTAAKYANQNMGNPDERWTDKQKHEIESKSLADIIAKTGIVNK